MLTAEEPLEIRVVYAEKGRRVRKGISVTMRTPGNDEDLALGFLFTEGLIPGMEVVEAMKAGNTGRDNYIEVALRPDFHPEFNTVERNFYTTSACGICGKSSIDAVRTVCRFLPEADQLRVDAGVLVKLPDLLREQQSVFQKTGGLHACGLFGADGAFLGMREDVGRHNALDKLIGQALREGRVPLVHQVLMLSGRISFELVQKAAMAGIKVVAAVGAPSGLAVELAEEREMTLIGFLRGERFNIYAGAQRVVI